MSLTKKQIDALIDRNCGTNDTSYPVADKTADVNLALDEILGFMFPRGGTWQLDDANHTDYPIIFTNLISGQRDYTFTTDEGGNMILDIYRVMVADSIGRFYDLDRVDQQLPDSENISMVDGQNLTGRPARYDKTANGIFLDLIPDYNYASGLKVFINREASYFTAVDTTKKAGFAHLFHEYLALRPSYQYAYRNGLSNLVSLRDEMLRMQQEIKTYYDRREKDVEHRIIMEPINFL